MREYVFLLTYDRGIDPVRDVFIDQPDMVATALDISASPDGGWRIERITGPEEALDELETLYLNPEICNECVFPHPACDAEFEYQVLEREPTARTIYRFTTDVSYCHSVSYLAVENLGSGLVFDATQRGADYEWRILVPDEERINGFYETLRENLPDGVSFDVRQVGTADRWQQPRSPHHETDLPYEQREALETAIRLGYYSHPRDATLEHIADELDIPLTTLRYRLRRAEEWAVTGAFQNVSTDSTTSGAQVRVDDASLPVTQLDED